MERGASGVGCAVHMQMCRWVPLWGGRVQAVGTTQWVVEGWRGEGEGLGWLTLGSRARASPRTVSLVRLRPCAAACRPTRAASRPAPPPAR